MTKIEIYGDFHACGFSRAAKAAAEDWFRSTPYCSSAYTLVFHEVPLAHLRAYKGEGSASSALKPMLERIRKAASSHNLKASTMPAIFIGPKWVKDGYSGLDTALKSLVCTLPSKKTPRRKTQRRLKSRSHRLHRSRSKSRGHRSKSKRRVKSKR